MRSVTVAKAARSGKSQTSKATACPSVSKGDSAAQCDSARLLPGAEPRGRDEVGARTGPGQGSSGTGSGSSRVWDRAATGPGLGRGWGRSGTGSGPSGRVGAASGTGPGQAVKGRRRGRVKCRGRGSVGGRVRGRVRGGVKGGVVAATGAA
ncbi:unnamed protein product [Closterium sp. NIES-53]